MYPCLSPLSKQQMWSTRFLLCFLGDFLSAETTEDEGGYSHSDDSDASDGWSETPLPLECCAGPVTLDASGAVSRLWPQYLGEFQPTSEEHNRGRVYVNSKGLFLYVNDNGDWSANTVINDRGVFKGD